MQRQSPLGAEMLAHFHSRESRKGERLEVRSRLRLPDVKQRHAARCREYRTADQAADAPLIGRHAMGRVPFHMLDVLEALTLREPDVNSGDIVLQIDEGLAPTGNFPDRR